MSLQLKLAHWMLKQKENKVSRKVKVHNFDTAKTVIVLWSFEEKDALQIVQQHLKSNKNITLESLYFEPDKKVTPESENSFYKMQLNWLGFAKEGPAVNFLQKEPDILIDLSVKKQFPVQVLLSLSKAAFKVGYSTEENNPYDLNIDIHQNPSSDYLAKQIIYYLNLINKEA